MKKQKVAAILLAPFLFFCSPDAGAQILAGAEIRFSDNFSEWNISTTENRTVGELRLRWASGDDWTAWDYRVGDHTGQIKLKWTGNPNEWEIRGDNQIVNVTTQWRGDFRQWRTEIGGKTILFGTRYNNALWDWEIKSKDFGYFGLYTTWEGDPRNWVIVDELTEEVSLPEKMAMVFIALFHTALN